MAPLKFYSKGIPEQICCQKCGSTSNSCLLIKKPIKYMKYAKFIIKSLFVIKIL